MDELEKKKLEQELRHNSIKLYVSIVGAFLVLLGLVIDRINTHDQRKHEFNLAQFNQRLSRMNLIAEDFDKLLGQTSGVLYRNRTRTWQLINEIGLLHQELRDLKVKNQEINRIQEYIDDVHTKLADASISVDEWADAAAIEAKWDALIRSPTPDFEHYYGKQLLGNWTTLRTSAIEALKAEYSIQGTHPTEKLESFKKLGAEFQASLYEKISIERASGL